MSNGTNPTILNPDTYLNHLSPDQAKQFEVARNVYLVVLGVVAGDVLSYIPDDVRILRRHRGLVTTTCFAFVRIFAIIYVALWVALLTTPTSNCNGITIATGLLCIFTMGSTSFLFLRRVQAIYTGNRWVQWIFTLLWIGTTGIDIMLIPGTGSKHIPGTAYCIVYKARPYIPIVNYMPAVFDTFVFFAISYKIAFQHNQVPGPEQSWTSSWFSAKTLPMLSKAILQGGQQYYFIIFGLNVLSAAFSFNPKVPSMHRVLLSVPGVAFSACLACRAHRIMVAAYYRDGDEGRTPPLSGIEFACTGTPSVVSIDVVKVEKTVVEPKRLIVESERSRGSR